MEIGEVVELSGEQVRAHIADLQAHDLLGMDKSATAIAYAYPFAGSQTEHRSSFVAEIFMLCAIDALGIGGMFRTETAIHSRCRTCGISIEIRTADAGKSLAYATPGEAVVWYDLAYAESAAVSCCPSIAFFCSDGELQRWLRAQSPQPEGYRLALDEALELGRALFEPLLAASAAG